MPRDSAEHVAARITVANRTYAIVPMTELKEDREIYCEAARFTVEGCTFTVVEEPTSSSVSDCDNDTSLCERLSARELQIALLVSQGHPTKRIAAQLQISEWTVLTHLRRIFAKLDVDNRAAMVYRCAPLIQRMKFNC